MTQKTTPNKSNEFVDVFKLFALCFQKWYLFVAASILFVGFGFVYMKLTSPIYQINANVLIKEENGKSSGGLQSAMLKSFSMGGMLGGSSAVDDELRIISSFSILREAAQSLSLHKSYKKHNLITNSNLYLDSPLAIEPVLANLPDTLSIGIRFKIAVSKEGKADIEALKGRKTIGEIENASLPATISTSYGNFVISSTPFYVKDKKLKMTITYLGYDLASEETQENVSISLASKKANVVALELKETNKQRGKDLLNKIIELYNKSGVDTKNEMAKSTDAFLGDRIKSIAIDLDLLEKDIEVYKKANSLTDIEQEAGIILKSSGDFKEKQIAAETNYSIVELIERFVSIPANRFALIPYNVGVGDKSTSDVLLQYNTLLLERMKLLRNSSETNPMVIQLNEQVDALRDNVLETIKSLKASIKIGRDDLRAQESIFLSRIKGMPTQEREFVSIKRQQLIKQELYVFLLQKREENSIMLASTTPKGQIIDQAYTINKPLSPKGSVVYVIALFLALAIPLIYLYVKMILNVTFSTKEELEAMTAVPVLGEICLDKSGQQLVVKEGDNSSTSELFRLIRTNIQFILNHKSDKVILVTSTTSGEGKSFFSANFALSLALMNKRVILVGLDIRNPQLSSYFEVSKTNQGLTVYLSSDEYQVSDIVVKSKAHANLDQIQAGPIPPNPAELLLTDRLDSLFAALRASYDYVIVDTAPVGMVSDTFCLTRVSDATIYICRADYSEKKSIEYVDGLVQADKLKKVSLVINGTKGLMGYGYGKR